MPDTTYWNDYSAILEYSELRPPRSFNKLDLVGHAITIAQNQDDPVYITEVSWNAETDLISCDNNSYTNIVANVSQVDAAYDQINRLNVMWVASDTLFLYWYDAFLASFVTVNFGIVSKAAFFMDDVRHASQFLSTMWLIYERDRVLYARKQIDRFAVEYTIHELEPEETFKSVGMNKFNRLQISLGAISTYDVATAFVVVDGKYVTTNNDLVGVKT